MAEPNAREWKDYRYEEVYKIDIRGRVLQNGKSAIKATLGGSKNPVAVGWSVSEQLPNGDTKTASIEEALQNLASKLTGK